MPYNKVRRNKIDQCNLCLKTRNLSWDHVPPKGGISLSAVEIKNIFETLAGRKDTNYDISQNGVKYRTLCSVCNSRLGSEHDTTLNKLNLTVGSFLKSTLILPKVTHIKTKPIRLIKSVLGHLIAAKIDIHKARLDDQVRQLIFSDTAIIPTDINIFYWVYPYDNTIIMRDFATLAKSGDNKSFAICNVLKYFPVAFLVTNSSDFRGLECLTKYRTLNIDDEVDIRVVLNRVADYDWPEKVDDNNLIFLSGSTQKGIIANRR